MKPEELLRRLRRLARRRNWTLEVSDGRNHTNVRLRGKRTVIGRHSKDLKPGTLNAILKQLEIDAKEVEN